MGRASFIIVLALALASWAISDVQEIYVSNYETLTSDPSKTWLLSFYSSSSEHSKEFVPILERTATALKPKGIKVAQIDAEAEDGLSSTYEVKGYPHIVLVKEGKYYVFQGERSVDNLVKFAEDDFALEEAKDAPGFSVPGMLTEEDIEKLMAKLNQQADQQNSDLEMPTGEHAVVDLTDENIDRYLTEHKGTWFIEFYAPWCGHCKNLGPTWEHLARALKGTVNVGKMDVADVNPFSATRFEIHGFPTLKLFVNDDSGNTQVYDYNSGTRTLDALKRWALEGYKSDKSSPLPVSLMSKDGEESVVINLTDGNFDLTKDGSVWFLAVYTPWCPHCKKLIPTWEKLAHELKGQVNIAKLDANEHIYTAKRLQVQGYPTLFIIKGNNMWRYSGESRKLSDLKQFALGGYATDTSTEVPSPLTLWDEIMEVLQLLWDDLKVVYKHKKLAMGIIFAAGTIFGAFLVAALSAPPKKRPPPKQQPTPIKTEKKDK